MPKPLGVAIGDGKCPIPSCTFEGPYKANKKGHAYFYCANDGDGGCNTSIMSRSDKGDQLLAKLVKKWRKPEYRAAYLGGDPSPEAAPEPEPKAEPLPEPKAEPKPEPKAAPSPAPEAAPEPSNSSDDPFDYE